MNCMHPAIFLDRDGVLIENRPNYVREWGDVEIFPGALQILARIAASPYKVVVVTNQAGVGRGLYSLAAVEEINRRLALEVARAGGRIDAFFICPHRPEDRCACRKPAPGLVLEAARALDLDLNRSLLIGDALTDLQAGQAAGVPRLALVRTGRGAEQSQLTHPRLLHPFTVYDDLAAALVELIPLA